jgi:hypothetical protein
VAVLKVANVVPMYRNEVSVEQVLEPVTHDILILLINLTQEIDVVQVMKVVSVV